MRTIPNPAAPASDPAVEESTSLLTGCVGALVLLNLVQVLAAFSGTEPHPPTQVVPFTAAIAAIGAAALPMIRVDRRLGLGLAIATASLSMVGMGPHKLLLEDGLTIAPVALTGFAAEVAIMSVAARRLRAWR
jgi:hypothetical protein